LSEAGLHFQKYDVSGVGCDPHVQLIVAIMLVHFYFKMTSGSLVNKGIVFEMSTSYKLTNIIEDLPP
jgi:hypothetical protein